MVEYHINHAAVYSVSSSTSPRPSLPPLSTCRGLATSNAYTLDKGHRGRYRHPEVQHVQPTAYRVLMELPSGQDTLSRGSVARPNRWIRKHSPWSNLQQPGSWSHSISHVPAGPCSSKGSYDRPAWTFLRSGPFRRCLRSIPFRRHLRSGTSRRFLRSSPFLRCLRSGPFRRHLRSSTSRRCLRSGTSRRFLRSGPFRRHLRSSTPRRCLRPGTYRRHLRPGPIRPGPFPHHLHTSAARTRVPAGYHHRSVGVYLSTAAVPILPTTAGISPSTTTHYDLAIPTTPPLPSHQAGTTTRNDRSLRRTAPTPAQTGLSGPCSNDGRHRPLLKGHPAHCGPARRRDRRTGPVPTIQRSCQSRRDHFT